MDQPNKVNKTLEIAKDINAEVQTLVNKLFEKCEASPALKATDPDMYFMHSNRILTAIAAAASQRMLSDGLMRRRLSGKFYDVSAVAWDLFLHNNPDVAAKIQAEKEAKEAAYKASIANQPQVESSDDDSDND
jgi:hypothetical protein